MEEETEDKGIDQNVYNNGGTGYIVMKEADVNYILARIEQIFSQNTKSEQIYS